jgi:hypothetical protein
LRVCNFWCVVHHLKKKGGGTVFFLKFWAEQLGKRKRGGESWQSLHLPFPKLRRLRECAPHTPNATHTRDLLSLADDTTHVARHVVLELPADNRRCAPFFPNPGNWHLFFLDKIVCRCFFSPLTSLPPPPSPACQITCKLAWTKPTVSSAAVLTAAAYKGAQSGLTLKITSSCVAAVAAISPSVGLALTPKGVRLVTWNALAAVVNWCLRPHALLLGLLHHFPGGCQVGYVDYPVLSTGCVLSHNNTVSEKCQPYARTAAKSVRSPTGLSTSPCASS